MKNYTPKEIKILSHRSNLQVFVDWIKCSFPSRHSVYCNQHFHNLRSVLLSSFNQQNMIEGQFAAVLGSIAKSNEYQKLGDFRSNDSNYSLFYDPRWRCSPRSFLDDLNDLNLQVNMVNCIGKRPRSIIQKPAKRIREPHRIEQYGQNEQPRRMMVDSIAEGVEEVVAAKLESKLAKKIAWTIGYELRQLENVRSYFLQLVSTYGCDERIFLNAFRQTGLQEFGWPEDLLKDAQERLFFYTHQFPNEYEAGYASARLLYEADGQPQAIQLSEIYNLSKQLFHLIISEREDDAYDDAYDAYVGPQSESIASAPLSMSPIKELNTQAVDQGPEGTLPLPEPIKTQRDPHSWESSLLNAIAPPNKKSLPVNENKPCAVKTATTSENPLPIGNLIKQKIGDRLD